MYDFWLTILAACGSHVQVLTHPSANTLSSVLPHAKVISTSKEVVTVNHGFSRPSSFNVLYTAAVRKNWLQRWFVLDFVSGDLAYFENKEVCGYETFIKFLGQDLIKNVCLLCRLSVTKSPQRE